MSKVVLPQLNDVIVPPHLQGPSPSFEVDQEEVDPSAQYAEASNRLGDLEPPLRNIELLFSDEAIQEHEDMEFLLGDQDPISALVAYELGVPKRSEPSPLPQPSPTLPPPLPSAQAPAKGKGKKGAKDVELVALDNTPGFRAPVPRVQGEPTPIPIPAAGSSGFEHEPQLIETIDKQQSFKMFNEGWILPPDQKRGGRVRMERPPPLPPKKKKSRV